MMMMMMMMMQVLNIIREIDRNGNDTICPSDFFLMIGAPLDLSTM